MALQPSFNHSRQQDHGHVQKVLLLSNVYWLLVVEAELMILQVVLALVVLYITIQYQ